MNEDAIAGAPNPWARQAPSSSADDPGPRHGEAAAAIPASGWYPDPADPARQRFWDGAHWTAETRSVSPTSRPTPATVDPYAAAAPATSVRLPGDPYAAAAAMRVPPPAGPAPVPAYPAHANPYLNAAAAAPSDGTRLAPGVARTVDGVPLAGWWWRVLATVIDMALLSFVAGSALIYTVFGDAVDLLIAWFNDAIRVAKANSTALPPLPPELVPLEGKYTLALAAVTFVYCVAFLVWRGATPGQMLCGLRVVPFGQGRHQGGLSWVTAAIRVAVYLLLTTVALGIVTLAAPDASASLGGLFLILMLLTWLWPLWQPGRRGLQDLAARTQVVRP